MTEENVSPIEPEESSTPQNPKAVDTPSVSEPGPEASTEPTPVEPAPEAAAEAAHATRAKAGPEPKAAAESAEKAEAEPKAEAAPAGQDEQRATGGEPQGRPDRHAPSRGGRGPSSGVAHVKATFNNTMVSITDSTGGVVAWSSGGRAGFKGSRKSTAFAATIVGQEAARQAMSKGLREVEVRVQGAGAGRESAVRALQSAGMNIMVIKDVTPIPHNGCRPRKRRRV